jgi:hypothetical protein
VKSDETMKQECSGQRFQGIADGYAACSRNRLSSCQVRQKGSEQNGW